MAAIGINMSERLIEIGHYIKLNQLEGMLQNKYSESLHEMKIKAIDDYICRAVNGNSSI